MTGRRRPWRAACGIAVVYLVLAVFYTWPLLRDTPSRIAVHTSDPVICASILWWNATTLPFSTAWWNGLHYYPSQGVSAFTESLAGINVLATPIFWLTGDPIATYNIAFFLTWPLSAFSAYLLVLFLTRRQDAAFLAGLAYAFTPYRTTELGHLQMLSSYWMPLCLLGLHGFLEDRRTRWLWLFGVAWVLQSLCNGHLMFFGGVLIGLWLAYFCSTRERWRAGAVMVAAWAVASLPLLPILLKYRDVHEYYGLHRVLSEVLAFSARPHSWLEVSDDAWFWRSLIQQGRDNLFPGITAPALVLAAGVFFFVRRRAESTPEAPRRRSLRIGLGVAALLSMGVVLSALVLGPWRVTVAGVLLRVSNVDRALGVSLASGLTLLLMTRRTRDVLLRRNPLLFYIAATIVTAWLCCGPVLRVGDEPDRQVIMSHAPYAWLMALPGFTELRVPLRFWMLGTMCLSVAAGLGFQLVRPVRAGYRSALVVVVAVCCLIDGWMPTMRMDEPPEQWAAVEPRGRTEPLLELPIGGAWDYSATFRAGWHRRRVVNGVSGYNPPHYIALMSGLQARDPATLEALASLGAIDVVVNGDADPDGAIARYVSEVPGAIRAGTDGHRTVYRIPQAPSEPTLGAPLPIAHVQAFKHDILAGLVHDGRIETGWGEFPQYPGQWLVVDLGSVQEVGGITHAIGEYLLDFPRRLAIEVSRDGSTWERVWEGPTFAQMFLASVRAPRETAMRFALPPRQARFVRLQELESYRSMWRVSELQVHAPR